MGSEGPSWEQKSIKNRSKFEVQVRVPLGIDFSSILGGFGRQVGRENRTKSEQKGIRISMDFCMDFLSILAPFWEPSWSHVGHLFRAKTPQDAPRTATRRPKTPPRHPKTPQDAPRHPQDAPKAPKTLPRRRFWKDFGDILEDFGKIFGRLLGRISCPTCLLKLTFQEPPEVLINWRGGTKAQPSSIRLYATSTIGHHSRGAPCGSASGYLPLG